MQRSRHRVSDPSEQVSFLKRITVRETSDFPTGYVYRFFHLYSELLHTQTGDAARAWNNLSRILGINLLHLEEKYPLTARGDHNYTAFEKRVITPGTKYR